MPTPPAPKTATDEPGVTCAVFNAAPDARGHGTAHQRSAVEWNVLRDFHHGARMQQHGLGKAAEIGIGVNELARRG
jgi:hypothetical protein